MPDDVQGTTQETDEQVTTGQPAAQADEEKRERQTGKNIKTLDEALSALADARDEAAKRRIKENELQAQIEQINAEQRKGKEKELAEQQRWQELAEQREKELQTIQAQLEAERKAGQRSRIALEAGLPAMLQDRIKGDDEDAMRDDAKKLAELFRAAQAASDSAQDDKPEPTEQPDNEARRRTTTAAPGGRPVGKTDEDRKSEYFKGKADSPIFQGGGVQFPSTD